jgi:D-alanyl-D-alanine carboxypeptidase
VSARPAANLRRPVRRLLIPLAAIAAIAVITAPASAETPKRADAKLDRAMRELTRIEGGPPGVGVIVDRGGRPRFHRTGLGTIQTDRPLRRNEHMRIASVAKAFNGAVALTLVDRGKLSLDDTIGEVLPELPDAWSQVTLAQALQHTGGLPDYIKSDAFISAFISNLRQFFFPQDLIRSVSDQPLTSPPGTRYLYSDTDNIVVALMAEAVTGRSYEALLRRLVYKPLGLKRTLMPDGTLMPRPFIHGYEYLPDGSIEDVSQLLNASGAWASGGITSTPADLNRFIRGYAGGKLFGGEARARQLDFLPGGGSFPPGPGGNSAGLGIFRYRTDCGTLYGASGTIPGYTQLAAASPSGRRSTIVSINNQLYPEATPEQFPALGRVFERAACAALAG